MKVVHSTEDRRGWGTGQNHLVWRGLIPLRLALSGLTIALIVWSERGQAMAGDARLLFIAIAIINMVISIPFRQVEGRVGDVSRIVFDSILSLCIVFLSTSATSSLVWVALFVPVIEAAVIAPIAAVAIWFAVSLLYTSLRVILPGATDASFITGIQQLLSVGIVGIPLARWSYRTSLSLRMAAQEKRSAGQYASSLRDTGEIVSQLTRVRTFDEIDDIVIKSRAVLGADRGELLARGADGRWSLIQADGAYLRANTLVLLESALQTPEPATVGGLDDVNAIHMAGFRSAVAIDLGDKRSAVWRLWITSREMTQNDLEALDLLVAALRQAYQTVSEIERLKAWSEELEKRANLDQLTGVLNRGGLDRAMGEWPEDSRLAVFYLDLNGFKPINDQFGHDCGDHVLEIAASRFGSCLPPGAHLARLGGDEFAVVAEIEEDDAISRSDLDVTGLRSRLEKSLDQPISHQRQSFLVSVSVGAATGNLTLGFESLLRRADTDMYERKRATGRATKPVRQG